MTERRRQSRGAVPEAFYAVHHTPSLAHDQRIGHDKVALPMVWPVAALMWFIASTSPKSGH